MSESSDDWADWTKPNAERDLVFPPPGRFKGPQYDFTIDPKNQLPEQAPLDAEWMEAMVRLSRLISHRYGHMYCFVWASMMLKWFRDPEWIMTTDLDVQKEIKNLEEKIQKATPFVPPFEWRLGTQVRRKT